MKFIDKYLQKKRMQQVLPYIENGMNILDIGCHQGELFEYLQKMGRDIIGVGLDPLLERNIVKNKYKLFKDSFPSCKIDLLKFDIVILLAVLEHIPINKIDYFILNINKLLKPRGKVLISIPSQKVDIILDILIRIKMIHGMKTEQHYGFDIRNTEKYFSKNYFKLETHKKFQLGLNNFFVFVLPESVID